MRNWRAWWISIAVCLSLSMAAESAFCEEPESYEKSSTPAEEILLLDLIDWQQTEIERLKKAVEEREAIIAGDWPEPKQCGLPWKEMAVGVAVGVVLCEVLD